MPRRKMSVTQLTLLTSLSMMGAGIIMLPAKFAEIGAISMLSWIVTALASGAVAYVFAQCGMLSKRMGGLGGFAKYAFGEPGAFLVFLCNLARLRQHCHLSGCSELRSELVPSAIFFSICLYRLRTPFMDRIASHFPLALHHGPPYRYLRLGSPTALDYACYCRRLLV